MGVYGRMREFVGVYGSTPVNSRLFVCILNVLCLILRSEFN
jgi:hypothetical protein